MIKNIFKNRIAIFIIGLIFLSLILHLSHLSWPDWQIFDEIYYFNWGGDYLRQVYFFDVHPPLGKLIVSLGLSIFGNSIFGARFFQAIAGVSLIYIIYNFANILFKNKTVALFAAILFFLETSIFIESRFALINIFIIFFSLLSFTTFWKYKETKEIKYFYFSLLFSSLATSVKWTGASCLLVYAIFIIFDREMRTLFFSNFKKSGNYIFKFILISFLAIVLPYILIFTIDIVKGDNFNTWHKQAYDFHKNLKGSHPYASSWYQWYLDIRPIWFEFKQTPDGDIVGINQIGNPIILWVGTISIFFNIIWAFIKKKSSLFLVLIAITVNTVPWIFIKRESFYYHFIPIIPFLILSLSYFLYLIYDKWKLKIIAIGILILALGFFVWYWPLLNGIKIPFKSYNERILFKSWR